VSLDEEFVASSAFRLVAVVVGDAVALFVVGFVDECFSRDLAKMTDLLGFVGEEAEEDESMDEGVLVPVVIDFLREVGGVAMAVDLAVVDDGVDCFDGFDVGVDVCCSLPLFIDLLIEALLFED
jgi:hypothetical protein